MLLSGTVAGPSQRIRGASPHASPPDPAAVGTAVGTVSAHAPRMAHELDPEYATVGGLLLAPEQLDRVSGWLLPSDFANPACGEVYGVLLAMRSDAELIDPVTVLARLRRDGGLDRGAFLTTELIRMVETVPAPVSTSYYATLVLENAMFRSVELAGGRLTQVGHNRRGTVDDAFTTVGEVIADLRSQRERWQQADLGRPMPALRVVDPHPLERDVEPVRMSAARER